MTATVLALLLLGQAAAAPTSPQPSLQQRFEAATQAGLDGKCEQAIAMFEELERRPSVIKNLPVAATISLRKGVCLIRIDRDEEGESIVRRALPQLIAGGNAYRDDVRDGYFRLGQLAAIRFDYAEALAQLGAALAVSKDAERILPLMLMARIAAFDGGPQPLAYADEALALIRANPASKKDDLANGQALRARVLMNQGRHKEAYRELKAALAKSGGLTTRVSLGDIVTRSDLAIAAMLNDDREGARLYLAYTGAGRMKDAPFSRATYMSPPACGGLANLKPSDFAVVEFSLRDDGSVADVAPVYTTGGRAVALEFARTVSQWSWKPENVKAIPPFFRHGVRIELRCSAAAERPSLLAPLAAAAEEWTARLDGTPASAALASANTDTAVVRGALQRERAAGNKAAVIALALWLGSNELVGETERVAHLDEAITLSRDAAVPQSVRTRLAIARLDSLVASDRQWRRRQDGLRALLADADVQSDPLSLATVRLLIAMPVFGKREEADTPALLEMVVAEPRLPERHPLKVAALLQQADRFGRGGDLAGAQQAFAQTGLSEEQCALIGVRPKQQTGAWSEDYPEAALMMRFEGWVQTEFDIAADGSTARQRAIASYPPFIFNDAATGVLKNIRYERSYRPEGGVACSASSESVNFRLP